MARSLAAGRRITLREVGLFSDGTAVRQVGRETFRLCRRFVDEIVTVDNDALCAAIKDVFQDTRSILEPAGALGVAGAKAYAARDAARRQDDRGRDLRREHELRSPALRGRAGRGGREARGGLRGDHPRAARQLQAPLQAGRRPQRDRVQLPHLRHRRGAGLRRRPAGPAGRGAGASPFVRRGRLSDPRSHRRRAGQAAPAPPGRRPLDAGQRRAPLPVRVPRAPGRAHAIPRQHVAQLEHLPVSLPKPGGRSRPRPRRAAGPSARSCGAAPRSWPSSATATGTRPTTPPTSCFFAERATASKTTAAGPPGRRGRLSTIFALS